MSVNESVTLLLTAPASSVVWISIVFRPFEVNTPELIVMAKLPKEVGRVARIGHDRLAVIIRLRVKAADDLPVGRVARGLVDDRDPGGAAKAGDLAFAVDGGRGGRDDRIPSAVPGYRRGKPTVVGNSIGARLMANSPSP